MHFHFSLHEMGAHNMCSMMCHAVSFASSFIEFVNLVRRHGQLEGVGEGGHSFNRAGKPFLGRSVDGGSWNQFFAGHQPTQKEG